MNNRYLSRYPINHQTRFERRDPFRYDGSFYDFKQKSKLSEAVWCVVGTLSFIGLMIGLLFLN